MTLDMFWSAKDTSQIYWNWETGSWGPIPPSALLDLFKRQAAARIEEQDKKRGYRASWDEFIRDFKSRHGDAFSPSKAEMEREWWNQD